MGVFKDMLLECAEEEAEEVEEGREYEDYKNEAIAELNSK
jgi:hypothetical protein